MPALQFTTQNYEMNDFSLPPARLVNMYVQASPNGPSKDVRLPRPGLLQGYEVGSGPIRGLYQQEGVFGGDVFAVSGVEVYRSSTLLGTVADGDFVQFAASSEELVITSGGNAYIYDGSTLTEITDPDLPSAAGVVTSAGRFVYTTVDSDVFYYSEINDAGNIDGLAFATAEGSPDPNIGITVLIDEIFFLGASSVEMWFPTGDADAPYQRTLNRRFERGCAAQGSVVKMDNTVVWLGNDRIVYRAGNVPERISTHGVEQALQNCGAIEDCTAWEASFDGHTFYALNIPEQATFVYDAATQQWAEWQSYGRETFRIRTGINVNGAAYLGDDDSGDVWTFDRNKYEDGDDPLTRLASAFAPMPGGTAPCFSVMVQCVRGVGNSAAPNPKVSMRYSDDGGRLWSSWTDRTLGRSGRYGDKAVWWRQGIMRSPGRLFEFRITDPVLGVMSQVTLNEGIP